MKITSGLYKFKKIEVIKTINLRPTSNKVRQAFFNILSNRYNWKLLYKDSHLLDAFSGSGIITIEAFSRNLSKATLIEEDKKIFKVLENNISKFKLLNKVNLIRSNFFDIDLEKNAYNLVFLDAPYNKDINNKAINKILDEKSLRKDSILACESEKNYKFNNSFLKYIDLSKTYGKTSITFFKFS